MKTSKITRTFVFVLGAIAAAGSAEGMAEGTATDIPRTAGEYVRTDRTVTLTKAVTFTATGGDATSAGVGGWIGGGASAATPEALLATHGWDATEGGTIALSTGGAIAATGGLDKLTGVALSTYASGAYNGVTTNTTLHAPFTPGVNRAVTLAKDRKLTEGGMEATWTSADEDELWLPTRAGGNNPTERGFGYRMCQQSNLRYSHSCGRNRWRDRNNGTHRGCKPHRRKPPISQCGNCSSYT